jgi:hypothetical protein
VIKGKRQRPLKEKRELFDGFTGDGWIIVVRRKINGKTQFHYRKETCFISFSKLSEKKTTNAVSKLQ